MEQHIRSCTMDDCTAVFPLLEQLWPYLRLDPTAIAQAWSVGLQTPNSFYFCCEVDGRIVGFASLSIRPSLWQQAWIAYVGELVVDAPHRGRGIGKALLAFLTEFAKARGCTRLELDSGFRRLGAHQMYEHCGLEKRAFIFSKLLRAPQS